MAPRPGSPPGLSNNECRIQHLSDLDHPDAPLPIEVHRDDEQQSLVEYEPRPIEDDEEAAAAAARPRRAWQASLRVFWLRNKGMFLVLLAQMFGASMNVMTKVLEMESSMHPFQVCISLVSIRRFSFIQGKAASRSFDFFSTLYIICYLLFKL